MEIMLFLVGVIGITHIVVDSVLFRPVRDWVSKSKFTWLSDVLHCHMCAGMWCGLICGFLVFQEITLGQLFVAGGAGSFLANFGGILLNYLDAQTILMLEDSKDV